MSVLGWIVLGSLAMSLIALVGAVTLILGEQAFDRLLLPLVALSAGSLLGGALFHMVPAGVERMGNVVSLYVWIAVGFSICLCLEQFLQWRHSHGRSADARAPVTYLILVADGIHNFIDGLAVAGAFLIDVRVGASAWLAAAAHEVPQELGDFGILVHGGWSKRRALAFNLLSGLAFLAGGLVAYAGSLRMDVGFLLPLAAGNFLYIAAADLIPEIKKQASLRHSVLHFAAFSLGVGGPSWSPAPAEHMQRD